MRPRDLRSPGLGVLLLAAACTTPNPAFVPPGSDGGPRVDLPPGSDALLGDGVALTDARSVDAFVLPNKPQGVDVLIVVDNSPGMGVPQQLLAQEMDTLLASLDALPGKPSYRVGIVSTDLGAGPYVNDSCPQQGGDGGELLVRSSCPQKPKGGVSYVERTGQVANVDGSVASALSCLVRLGENGCGFEQPLESMHVALSGANPGFLRPAAALAVILLGNEDDCSAANTELYNPEAAELGQYGSYRCFRHGVLCDGVPPPEEKGTVQNCAPGQAWLHPLQRYVDFFARLKPNGWVSLLAISGKPEQKIDIVEERTSRGPVIRLDTVCISDNSYAEPAVRLYAMAVAFGRQGGFESICAGSYAEAVRLAIARLRSAF